MTSRHLGVPALANFEMQARVAGNGNYIWTADAPAVELLTDLTVDWFGSLDSVGTAQGMAHKFSAVTGGRSWMMRAGTTQLESFISADGTAQLTPVQGTQIAAATNVGVRFTRRKSDGLARFYTSTVDPPSWTQVGTATNNAGVGQADTTAPLICMGGHTSGSVGSPTGYFRHAEFRNGFDGAGTLIASPDVRALPLGTTSFVDAQGLTWTLAGSAALVVRPKP